MVVARRSRFLFLLGVVVVVGDPAVRSWRAAAVVLVGELEARDLVAVVLGQALCLVTGPGGAAERLARVVAVLFAGSAGAGG